MDGTVVPDDSDGLAALVAFIADAFRRHELEAFVAKLPGGRGLIREMLDTPASPMAVADGLIHLLQRHGLLDTNFFVHLARERPRRGEEVNLIMMRYLPGPKPALQLQAGSILCGGQYRLVKLTAGGGFGKLWLAVDTRSGERVAIKCLTRDIPDADYAWRRAMFIRGASRMASIDHRHVARVLLPHVTEQGYDFCVLQYIEGESLHFEVKTKRLGSLTTIAGVLLDIGSGLTAMHAAGAIHGDVSPKNILVSRGGSRPDAWLVDFDLVCGVNDELTTTSATGIPATDPYAAPEWKTRQGPLDKRVDVFSLGMTAIYAFYGAALPPSLNDPEAMDPSRFIDEKIVCPQRIRDVLKKACAHDAESRYASVREFCVDFVAAVRASRSGLKPKVQFLAPPPTVLLPAEPSGGGAEERATPSSAVAPIGPMLAPELASTKSEKPEFSGTVGARWVVGFSLLVVALSVGLTALQIVRATVLDGELGVAEARVLVSSEMFAEKSVGCVECSGAVVIPFGRPDYSPQEGPGSPPQDGKKSDGTKTRKESSKKVARFLGMPFAHLATLENELVKLYPEFRRCFQDGAAPIGVELSVAIKKIDNGKAEAFSLGKHPDQVGFCIVLAIEKHVFPLPLTMGRMTRTIKYRG